APQPMSGSVESAAPTFRTCLLRIVVLTSSSIVVLLSFPWAPDPPRLERAHRSIEEAQLIVQPEDALEILGRKGLVEPRGIGVHKNAQVVLDIVVAPRLLCRGAAVLVLVREQHVHASPRPVIAHAIPRRPALPARAEERFIRRLAVRRAGLQVS